MPSRHPRRGAAGDLELLIIAEKEESMAKGNNARKKETKKPKKDKDKK